MDLHTTSTSPTHIISHGLSSMSQQQQQHVRRVLSHNRTIFRRQALSEISGSLGDLGTFLPIVIALTEGQQISLTTTLILTGIYNILTGMFFGIPLPVQPMKAIAAVAILKSLTAGQTAAAGIFVGIVIDATGQTGSVFPMVAGASLLGAVTILFVNK